jgi:hypothetical protein
MNAHLKQVESTAWQVALEIARETEETVQRLCAAVLSQDWATAKKLAKELQGEESNRTDSRVHRIAGRRR